MVDGYAIGRGAGVAIERRIVIRPWFIVALGFEWLRSVCIREGRRVATFGGRRGATSIARQWRRLVRRQSVVVSWGGTVVVGANRTAVIGWRRRATVIVWWQATIWYLLVCVLLEWTLIITAIVCYGSIVASSWYRLNIIVAAWERWFAVLSRLGLHIIVVVGYPMLVGAIGHRDAGMLHLRLTAILIGCCMLIAVAICHGLAVVGSIIWALRNSLRLNVLSAVHRWSIVRPHGQSLVSRCIILTILPNRMTVEAVRRSMGGIAVGHDGLRGAAPVHEWRFFLLHITTVHITAAAPLCPRLAH